MTFNPPAHMGEVYVDYRTWEEAHENHHEYNFDATHLDTRTLAREAGFDYYTWTGPSSVFAVAANYCEGPKQPGGYFAKARIPEAPSGYVRPKQRTLSEAVLAYLLDPARSITKQAVNTAIRDLAARGFWTDENPEHQSGTLEKFLTDSDFCSVGKDRFRVAMGDLLVKPDPRPFKVEVILELKHGHEDTENVIANVNKFLDGRMTCRLASKESK